MNMGRVPPPFLQNMQLQNEFPNSCFARIVDWERGITMATGGGPLPGPRRIHSATEMTFSWVKSTSNFLQ